MNCNQAAQTLAGFLTSKASLRLDPLDFEKFVLLLFTSEGGAGSLTPKSGDDGIDVVINSTEGKVVIQCKHYSDQNVSAAEVREFFGAAMHAKASRGFLVTTSGFTEKAIQFAAAHAELNLIDRHALMRLLVSALASGELEFPGNGSGNPMKTVGSEAVPDPISELRTIIATLGSKNERLNKEIELTRQQYEELVTQLKDATGAIPPWAGLDLSTIGSCAGDQMAASTGTLLTDVATLWESGNIPAAKERLLSGFMPLLPTLLDFEKSKAAVEARSASLEWAKESLIEERAYWERNRQDKDRVDYLLTCDRFYHRWVGHKYGVTSCCGPEHIPEGVLIALHEEIQRRWPDPEPTPIP